MSIRECTVTVFGGTGFLGSRLVACLLEAGCQVRVAARFPRATIPSSKGEAVVPVPADIRDQASVEKAVQGADCVINAVSLYVERGPATFDEIHVKGAEQLARCAKAAGVKNYLHVSGIGSRPDSRSRYVAARGRGELAVSETFPGATLVRPSVMIGEGDAFLSALVGLSRLPLIPLFGQGRTRLQPVVVTDVAQGMCSLLKQESSAPDVVELGGGAIYTYREAVATVRDYFYRRGVLVPVPFALWHILAWVLGWLPNPPLTRDQLILMQSDNTADPSGVGFAELGIQPLSLMDVLRQCYSGEEDS